MNEAGTMQSIWSGMKSWLVKLGLITLIALVLGLCAFALNLKPAQSTPAEQRVKLLKLCDDLERSEKERAKAIAEYIKSVRAVCQKEAEQEVKE
jgi:hypothetical protein